MTKIEGRAIRGGYVRAVFSQCCGGHALSLDLVRANLRAVAMVQRRAAVRARVAGEFGGYLVTDGATDDQDLALRALEISGGAAFVGRRARHRQKNDCMAMTGRGGRGPWSLDLHDVRFAMDSHGSIDAPDYLAAGGMRKSKGFDGVVVFLPMLAVREVSL